MRGDSKAEHGLSQYAIDLNLQNLAHNLDNPGS